MENAKKPSLTMAILIIAIPVLIVLWGGIILRAGFLVPLVAGTAAASIMGMAIGYKWEELQTGIMDAIHRSLIAVLILLLVGIMIGSWILNGTIPTLIYWGLRLITPSMFLATTFILGVIMSTATGTSFGTIGTVGLALIGVGQALGFPLPMVAGAIVSGAYFGDKMSPVSDTTNVAAATAEADLFEHVGSMMYTTIPAAVVAFVLYWVIGAQQAATAIAGDIPKILSTLTSTFNITVWTLIPPLVLTVLAYRRTPALPTLFISIVVGAVWGWLFQGAGLNVTIKAMTSGYVAKTGIKVLDTLLTRGGILNMMSTVGLIITGVAFGGVLEKTQSLQVVVDAMLERVKSTGGLIVSVIAACYLMLAGTGNQMVGIIVPGRAFAQTFKEKDIHPRVLSRTLEDAGTIGAPLIPWSSAAFYAFGVLGVAATSYAPYAFLNWIVPIFSIIYGYTGFAIWRRDGSPITRVNTKAQVTG